MSAAGVAAGSRVVDEHQINIVEIQLGEARRKVGFRPHVGALLGGDACFWVNLGRQEEG